jgi:hypothetical protein
MLLSQKNEIYQTYAVQKINKKIRLNPSILIKEDHQIEKLNKRNEMMSKMSSKTNSRIDNRMGSKMKSNMKSNKLKKNLSNQSELITKIQQIKANRNQNVIIRKNEIYQYITYKKLLLY